MLPGIQLREVTRADVDRIAGWLDDEEVSSRWFGQYACGNPVHRGYEPDRMLEAAGREWERVFFYDQRRSVFSIYDEEDQHIGECQVVIDDKGAAELSVLIGRKDLWHRGYGTSTVMTLLDQVFNSHRLERAWVSVPEDNVPALGLFRKLGFSNEATRELCTRRDGSKLYACIMAITAREFRTPRSRKAAGDSKSVVTITGLPGSGSEIIGAAIARLTGGRFVGSEILDRMCRRLKCSKGELQAVESMCQSIWGRLLAALAGPWESYGIFDGGYYWASAWPPPPVYDEPQKYVTKDQYLESLKGVIRDLALKGDVVIHGHWGHLFVPSDVPALRVLVTESDVLRRQRVVAKQGLDMEGAQKWLRRADKDILALSRNLFGSDLLDTRLYDMNLYIERWSYSAAAEAVVGALDSATGAGLLEVGNPSLTSSSYR